MRSNKISLNILCALVLAIIALAAVQFIVAFSKGFISGISDSSAAENIFYINIEHQPSFDLIANPTDSIRGADGTSYLYLPESGQVLVDFNKVPVFLLIIGGLCPLAGLALLISIFVQFVKFIININKGRIFFHSNVKYLSRIGVMLLLIALADFTGGFTDYLMVDNLQLSYKGENIIGAWNIPWTDLLLGIVSILMARVWDMGLKMKEEQELTI